MKKGLRQSSERFDALQHELGYKFRDISLLNAALTHASFGASNNKRLEFLGDSVLRMVLSEQLFIEDSEFDPSHLTQKRASLESNLNLADVAQRLKLDRLLLVSRGAKKDGGGNTDLALAGAFEAVLGAIYLDGSFADVRQVIEQQILSPAAASQPDSHPKTQLQERLDRDKGIRPTYQLVGTEGSENKRRWQVRCIIKDLKLETTAFGPSRKIAETRAAESMLALMQS